MKRTVCYYFAICLIPIHGFLEPNCTEPQLLVQETYCGYKNVTTLTMYTFKEEFRVNLTEVDLSDGCAIDFDEPFPWNNTYYIECDTEKVDCLNEDEENVTKESYYLECEELDKVSDKLVKAKGIVENNPVVAGNSGKIATIVASSVAALSGVVLFAYGAHKLKSLLQSGTYSSGELACNDKDVGRQTEVMKVVGPSKGGTELVMVTRLRVASSVVDIFWLDHDEDDETGM